MGDVVTKCGVGTPRPLLHIVDVRVCADKDMMKQKYWQYSVNELGVMDIKAQIQWIHNVKCDELRGRAQVARATSPPQMPESSVSDERTRYR